MNTTYFLNLVMGNLFRTKENPTLPANYYLGLSSTTPTIDGVCTGEPSMNGTGYERILLNNLSEPLDGVITNNDYIMFEESIAEWGNITHYVVYDAEKGGNLLFFGELSPSRYVEINTAVVIKPEALVLALSNA